MDSRTRKSNYMLKTYLLREHICHLNRSITFNPSGVVFVLWQYYALDIAKYCLVYVYFIILTH